MLDMELGSAVNRKCLEMKSGVHLYKRCGVTMTVPGKSGSLEAVHLCGFLSHQ